MSNSVSYMSNYEGLETAIAAQIRVELAEREMEQRELATAVGIESATLSRYMTGKRSMPMPTFFAVAEALGLSPRVLMERAEARLAR